MYNMPKYNKLDYIRGAIINIVGIAAAGLFLTIGVCLSVYGATERPDLAPRVIELSKKEMAELYCAGQKPGECSAKNVLAMYSNGIIYVEEGFDPAKDKDQGILIHELVHHVQRLAGRKGPHCGSEREAYETQQAYLLARDIDPDSPENVGKLMAGPLLRIMLYQNECQGLGLD